MKFKIINSDKRLYKLNIPVIGLTGGVATGKSTVSQILRQNNFPVICADSLVKQVYLMKKTINHLQKMNPEFVINQKINFKKLRKDFFSNNEIKLKIEKYIYAHLEEVFNLEIQNFPDAKYIIYDIPLLFEKNINKIVDLTICVYSTSEQQLNRLVKRDSINEELALKIISSQINIEDKAKKSDYVIQNTSNIEELRDKIDQFITKYL
ncbi:MAG: dephospho-CoA kinase [Bdellovibrionales bacterium]|nr:dephospho-CoA kinase [Bdellovibrionales bacterium]